MIEFRAPLPLLKEVRIRAKLRGESVPEWGKVKAKIHWNRARSIHVSRLSLPLLAPLRPRVAGLAGEPFPGHYTHRAFQEPQTCCAGRCRSSMSATPLSLLRVLRNPVLVAKVEHLLSPFPISATESHGITIGRKRGGEPRALVSWRDYPANRDAIATQIRIALGREWNVSQCGAPDSWSKFRTATEEDPYGY